MQPDMNLCLDEEWTVVLRFDLFGLTENGAGALGGVFGQRLEHSIGIAVGVRVSAPTPEVGGAGAGCSPWLDIQVDCLTRLEALVLSEVPWRGAALSIPGAVVEDAVRGLVRWETAVHWPRLRRKLRRDKSGEAGRELAVEIHLPFRITRVSGEDPYSSRPLEPFRSDAFGRILIGEEPLPWASLTAGQYLLYRQRTGVPAVVAFSDHRRLAGPEAEQWLSSVMGHYNLRLALPPGESWEAAWMISSPRHAATAWWKAPLVPDLKYFQQQRAVSLAVQRVLRLWLPYQYFSSGIGSNAPAMWSMLTYHILRMSTGKIRGELNYDVLEPARIREALRQCVAPMTGAIRRWAGSLRAPGQRTAEVPAPVRAETVLRDMERIPKLFGALIAGESRIIEDLFRILKETTGLRRAMRRDPAHSPRGVRRCCRNRAVAFDLTVRRLFAAFPFQGIADLCVASATAALATAQGKKTPLRIMLALRNPATGEERVAVSTALACDNSPLRHTLDS